MRFACTSARLPHLWSVVDVVDPRPPSFIVSLVFLCANLCLLREKRSGRNTCGVFYAWACAVWFAEPPSRISISDVDVWLFVGVRSPFRAKHHVVVQYMARWMKCPLPPPLPQPPPPTRSPSPAKTPWWGGAV